MFYFGGTAGARMLLGWTIALLLVRRLTRIAARGASPAGTATALGREARRHAVAKQERPVKRGVFYRI